MIFNFEQQPRKQTARGAAKKQGDDGSTGGLAKGCISLGDMAVGSRGVLGEFDLPEKVADQLMNLGFVPGLEVIAAQSGPGGDPRVYRVDGTEVALRRDLARLINVERLTEVCAEPERGTARSVSGSSRPDHLPVETGSAGLEPSATHRKEKAHRGALAVGPGTQEASAD